MEGRREEGVHYKMYIQCGEATMYDLKHRVEEIVNKNKQTKLNEWRGRGPGMWLHGLIPL